MLSSKRRRHRTNSSARIACEPLEQRELLSSISHHLAGGELRGFNRVAHVRGFGAHLHGLELRGHTHNRGATVNTITAPISSSSTSPDPNVPVTTGTAVGAQSLAGASGWSVTNPQYAGGGPVTNIAVIHDQSGVNPGGPMIAATGTGAMVDPHGAPGLPNPGGPMIAWNGSPPVALSSQAETDLKTLKSDVQAIEGQSQVTVADLTAFRSDLSAINPPSGQPSTAVITALKTLQSDQSAILASGTFTSAQQTQIVNDLGAVLTSEGATAAQASKASTDLQTIITASGLTSANVAQIDSDLKAIQTDLGLPSSMANAISVTASGSATSASSTTTSGATTTSGSTTTSSSTTSPPTVPQPAFVFGGGLLLSIVTDQGPLGPMALGMGGPTDMGIGSPMIMQSGDPMVAPIGGRMIMVSGDPNVAPIGGRMIMLSGDPNVAPGGGPMIMRSGDPIVAQSGGPINVRFAGTMNMAMGGDLGLFPPAALPMTGGSTSAVASTSTGGSKSTGGSTTS